MAYNVKFLKGTSAQLEGISRDLNTFYYVDDKDLFLGNIKLSNGADLAAAILRVAANEKDIKDLQDDIKALTGGETGSISGLIEESVNAAKVELRKEISANTTAIEAEVTRATGVEGGLETRLATVEGDYLKAADKTELEGKITAEATTARAAEKANADAIAAVKEDVDAFFKDATISEAAKDTLKEIQEYIDSDVQAAAAMTESLNTAKADIANIKKDYLKAEDKTELQGNIDTVAGNLSTLEREVAKKAAQSDLDTVSGKVTTLEGKVDVEKVTTAIAGGVTEAKGYTDTAIAGLSTVYDAKGAAATAESNAKAYAKEYADGLAGNYDVKGAAATAESNAKGYTDTEIEKLSSVYEAKGEAAKAEAAAKKYADDLAVNYDAAGSAAAAETAAKAYADGLANNYDATGSAAQALTDAKAYVGTEIAKLDADVKSAEVEAGKGIQVQVVEVDGKLTTVAVTGNFNNSYDAKGAAATAESNAVATAAGDATSKANTAEANAKSYVDSALTWGEIK